MSLLNRQHVLALVLFGASTSLSATEISNRNISEEEVKAAQQAWGKALIRISDDYTSGGIEKARQSAGQVIDDAYAYQSGPVLFKPTLASGDQTFRLTRAGALAYFVGNDPAFPIDKGFALKGWKDYRVDNAAIQIDGNSAYTMGKVHLTDAKGQVTTVDKSWGFRKGEDGKVRITLHHSSLPYAP
ncbi:hypothetical protein [Aeromonas schubertii]|uniref:Phosphoribosyl-AMP cyclohydrolase n=1 Tax=Aeromonas schubertii TaxID=652 RepID=A0A0S2SMZ9_9GAMM|nr:hypothetical protein [Aeromonas schubertii]ALP43015.1 hypothetical protein WL1483_3596 [Aeromonas schubertii]MBZ6073230.1 hypothetical protein [Aeromonas schubertii]QCG46795.1 hypothetical protein E2P79_02030 [Aeromonas schubertii]